VNTPRRIKDVLFVLALLGLVAALLRLGTGLGATTALSDEIPWGLWKVLNMIAGVALATGGFVLAFCVHVLQIKSLKPVLRPALLVAFLGYGSSCVALLLDIGLPHRFWHPIFFWNPHSFLFEVFWCVLLYFTVTAIEVSPIALESSRFHKVYAFLRKIGGPVVILGITFSTLHHTSLGSLFLVSATRLHDLWFSPWLPVLFILSAIGAGMMAVILVSLVAARLYHRKPPLQALRKIAIASGIVLSLYLVLKVADLLSRGVFDQLFSGQWEAGLFWVEILCAAVLPIVLVCFRRVRSTAGGLALVSVLAVVGLALNRLDVGVFAYFRSGATSYFPTLAELAVAVGIPAAAGLVYLAFVERFRVFDFEKIEPDAAATTAFAPQTGVWQGVFVGHPERLSLIAVVVMSLGVALFVPDSDADETANGWQRVQAPMGAGVARQDLLLDGNRNGDAVLFQHHEHTLRLGGPDSCATCHHLDRPRDRWTSCHHCHVNMERPRSIFDHDLHVSRVAAREGFTGPLAGNRSCSECHVDGQPRHRGTAKACIECHEEDMRMKRTHAFRTDLAPGYAAALHGSCVKCHEEKAEEVGKPDLGECRTCHQTERNQREAPAR
jgi:Ni/Fe-hydrogenase subunit HybB-like protein